MMQRLFDEKTGLTPLAKRVLNRLVARPPAPLVLLTAARELDVGTNQVVTAIDELRDRGFTIRLSATPAGDDLQYSLQVGRRS